MQPRRHHLFPFTLLSVLTIAACGSDIAGPHPDELDALKDNLSAYRSLSAAQAAGWDTPITPCWYATGSGGMGYHYGNPDLIDGTPSLENPEAFMYEPQEDGSMKLVGLEYIVPIAAWTGDEPPSLVGESFMRMDDLGLYALHIWLWEENPSGLYAPWNPKVSCDNAEESEDLG
jgi:hypothetical protein